MFDSRQRHSRENPESVELRISLVARVLFLGTAFLAGSAALTAFVLSMRSGANLDHVSGAVFTLANDLAHGLFYRPVYSPDIGYGGTRFQPLQFVLIASLIYCGISPIASGLMVNLAADILLVIASWRLLRREGISAAFACGWTLLLLASNSLRFALSDGRSDILATALTILGLQAIQDHEGRRSNWPVASIAFGLAFATKLTAIHGLIASVIWLFVRRERTQTVRVIMSTTAAILVVAVLTYVFSAGRIVELLRFGATGGAHLVDVMLGPAKMVWRLSQYDPAGLVFLSLACTVLLVRPHLSLLAVYFVVTAVMTAVIFGSPGIEINHLVDLHVASILLLASAVHQWAARQRDADVSSMLTVAASIAAFISLFPIADAFSAGRLTRSRPAEIDTLLASVPPAGGPILSEDPLVPIVAGESPYLMDAFMFRLFALRNEALERPLIDTLQRHGFRAVVLLSEPQDEWYTRFHFGRHAADAIAASYAPASQVGPYRIFVPRE